MNKTHTAFEQVINRASPYTTGKRLDTRASESGDTIVSPESIATFSPDAMEEVATELRDYVQMLNPEDINDAARLGVVERRLSEIALIGAALGQVTGEVDNSGEIARLEETLYEHYSPTLYRAALRQKIAILEAKPVRKEAELARALLLDELEGYADMVNIPNGESIELERPTGETLKAVGDWMNDQFGDAFDMVDAIESDTLDANDLKSVFDGAIASTPVLHDHGWQSEIVQREKNAITVYASDRLLVIPEQRKATKKVAKNLIAHESFGHALRSAMAESVGNEVGTTGTEGYSAFEESFEIALEQCLNGAYDPKRGLDHYITIGLSLTSGLSREKIAQLTTAIRQIDDAENGLSGDNLERAKRGTTNQMRRAFAGMTDVDDGIAHRQDINYLHGLNGAWRLLNVLTEAGQVDEGMRWLLSAKFDPYSTQDRELVNQFTPMPSSLKNYFVV
ncbi:hypothetical protein FQZ97_644970 [compost metagenome]